MTDDPTDDPRVLSLAREYLAELEAGRTPKRAGFENRFPELRNAVAECLDGVELAHAAGIALRPTSPIPAPDSSPEPLGDFRIIREIGRGGMGVVYEAVQLSLGRRVALKVLPFAAALDAKHLQRFKTEAHAAAQLHHSNIVPVYAVGCDRGTHYYAMQLIDGRPLDAVIRELRNDPMPHTGDSTVMLAGGGSTTPVKPPASVAATATATRRDRSAFATAARFAAQVADALDYAHDAGVVHRDIKPANLLLDARGTVWVTDFGLAQVQAEANVTRTGDVFGTLRYSSPEQATGRRTEVDHRTDVYSLGATLYELLTLKPIFPDTDRQGLLYKIIHDDPAPPRQHDKNIPPELETIVLKAVAKLPAERYQSAGEFAADLRRFLDDRPILARRPTVFDHARKWLRRHPAYTYAAVVVLLLASVGFAISTAVVSGAKRQTEDALAAVASAKRDVDDALSREKQRAKEAEDRFQIARRLADEHIRVANDELGNDPVQEGLRQRMLQTALSYYQEFIALRKDDPKAVEELEEVKQQVSGILSDLATMAGAGRLQLLRNPNVRDELKLEKPDGERLVQVLDADRVEFGRLGKLSAEEVNARLLDHARRLEKEIRPHLSSDQQKRLDQLFIQSRGGRAFELPDVVAALKLTNEDRDKLRQAERKWLSRQFETILPFGGHGGRGGPGGPGGPGLGKPGPGGPGGFGGKPRGPDGKPDGGPNASPVADMVALLRPDQQAAWKQLVGEPFNRFGGFGGGLGGPRQGGGRQ